MKPNEPDFENQLRALRPLAPSPALEKSIARQLASDRALVVQQRGVELERPSRFDRIFPGLRWALAGAAAAVAVVAAINRFEQPAGSTGKAVAQAIEQDFEPVEITRDLLAAEDGGVVYEDEVEPARVVRYTTLEHHVWTHPVTGARLEVEIPREDLVLIPISMQ